ncbi:4Fe-4S dicluster domain-containing protein [bacterium]|nr:4Fe-4S dicluster domain-containing protein [bacterium]
MKCYKLGANQLGEFVNHLQNQRTVFAPHKKGQKSFSFEKVENAENVVLNYPRTLSSIKKYFLPNRETLLNFDMQNQSFDAPKIEEADAVFLGVHSYDMQAVLKLDYNFSQGNPEKNYLKRRENAIFIGVSFTPDEFHFSASVGIYPNLLTGFDLFLHQMDDEFVVEVVTKTGEKLLDGFDLPEFLEMTFCDKNFKSEINEKPENLPEIFAKSWDNPIWKEMAELCVGCGTCNLVCPTCYCFNVEDCVNLQLSGGTRERHLDGCMLREFTEVAGGEVFRETLAARMRHRIYRKFKYISDTTGEPWCVGCGRCTASCTARISIVDIVNRLIEDFDKERVN